MKLHHRGFEIGHSWLSTKQHPHYEAWYDDVCLSGTVARDLYCDIDEFWLSRPDLTEPGIEAGKFLWFGLAIIAGSVVWAGAIVAWRMA